MLPEPTTAEGRDAAFRELALPHMASVARLARVIVGQGADADDLVQETYLRAFRYWYTFVPGSDCFRWLAAILRNVARDQYRKEDGDILAVEEADPWLDARPHANARDAGVEDMYDRLDLGPAIHEAVNRLPAAFREVVVLSDVEGLSYEEIALNLDIPVGTVRSRLYRARRHLQRALTKYAVDAGFAGFLQRSSE